MIPISYVFVLNDINKEKTLYDNINLVKSQNPSWIGVYHRFEDINENILNFLSESNIKHNVILSYEDFDDLTVCDKFIKNYPNSWNVINVVGEELLLDAQKKITEFTKNGQALLIKAESFNGTAFQTYCYKILNGNIINEEDLQLNALSYEAKLTYKYNGSNFIKNWEQINEACSISS
jgi:hypothetical protein